MLVNDTGKKVALWRANYGSFGDVLGNLENA